LGECRLTDCYTGTPDWVAFSEDMAGRFLHHQPLCMQPSPSEETARLAEFRQACLEHFGEVNVLIGEVVCSV